MKTGSRLLYCLVVIGLVVACLTPAALPPTPAGSATAAPPQATATTGSSAPTTSTPTNAPQPTAPPATPGSTQAAVGGPGAIAFVQGSTHKICQLSGETDRQLNQPTFNQTETRWGLTGNDLGYSFEHNGKLFFVFGDSPPTAKFKGQPNGPSSPPRMLDDNDAIAFTTDASIGGCPKLEYIHYPSGAFKNPVVLNAQGQPAITLRTDETPLAGISDGGRMYVIFGTDNPVYPSPGPTKGHLGMATRTVVGASDDDANTFHYLYDFSKGPDAKFINMAIAPGTDGHLYFWGTQGGDLYRKSAPFLARKPAGSLGTPNGLEYLHAVNSDGTPVFMPNESDATPLFHNKMADSAGQPQVADCMGELGVEWNRFVNRWFMLYNCADRTAANLPGIYMRTAVQPWGPWSEPQTIFDAGRDNGFCAFIHRAVTAAQPQCDNLSIPARLAEGGGAYGPYFLSRFTTGDAARGASTFYYTLSTWNPYTEVIMQTSIQHPP